MLALVRAAKRLDAEVKFQCFHPNNLAKKRAAGHLGKSYTYQALRDLYLETYLRASWWPDIIKELDGHPWSCSVFSESDLAFMEHIGCPIYKIASFELTDLQLIEAVARTGKPLRMSVNDTHKETDVMNAWDIASRHTNQITFLYATPYDAHSHDEATEGLVWLSGTAPPIAHLGLSDHSPPGDTQLLRLASETWMINMAERHLCLPDVHTPDSEFSDTPAQFQNYIEAARDSHHIKAG